MNNLGKSGIGVVILLCFSACSPVNHNIKQTNSFVFHAGVEKYLQGEMEVAYELVKQAFEVEPKNNEIKKFLVKIITEMAVSEVVKGNYKNAVALLNEAINIYPSKQLKKMYSRALNLQENGITKLETEKKLLEDKNRELMGKFFNTGTKLYERGKYRQAIASWQKVLKIDPNHKASKKIIKKAKKQLAKKNKRSRKKKRTKK